MDADLTVRSALDGIIPGVFAASRGVVADDAVVLDSRLGNVSGFAATPAPPEGRGHSTDGDGGGFGHGMRRGFMGRRGLCRARDLLTLKARTYTHPSMLMRPEPCERPEPGGIPQMARNFAPNMEVHSAALLTQMDVDSGGVLSLAERPLRVRQAKAQVLGPLDPQIVRRIVGTHVDEVRRCYALGLRRRPALQGRVAIGFSISARGRTSKAKVSRSSLHDAGVERCIVAAVRRWRFPRPEGGVVRVTSPFVLDRR